MLFTDIVGSTSLKQDMGDRAAIDLIQRHHSLMRDLLTEFDGAEEIATAGDSFFIVFLKPSDAARFALKLQSALRELSRDSGREVKDRVGIHVGEIYVSEKEDLGRELFGLQIDTAARVMSLGDGDQILLSRFAFDNARQVLRGAQADGLSELSWLNHGFYSLKGVEEPIEVCEIGEKGFAVLRPPGDSAKANRFHPAGDEPVLGWRPASGLLVPDTHWRLEVPLGEGGFGEVWLARHEQLKEKRVFKFCFNAERARSLKREVTLFRVLRERVGKHPNIVEIHDVFLEHPPYYIVMDYVEGWSLSEWAGVSNAPLARRLEIIAQIADALQSAHDAGVIHRDVKPSNILICQDDEMPHALLSDFGIGQVVSSEALKGVTVLGFTQTMVTPGTSAGTHLYMAPELIAGQAATIRSDIYALGVIVYQLAVGDIKRPLASDWSGDIQDPLLREDIRNCVAGDPAKRFAGAAQLATNLRELPTRREAFEEAEARLAEVAQRAYRRGVLRTASAALIIIAVVAALGIISFMQYRRAETSARRAIHARNEAEKLIEFIGVDLRDKLKPIGRLELLDSANQRVRAYYRSFTDTDKDPGILSRQSTAFLNEGMILRDRGDQAGALNSFQEAHAIRERLVREDPQNADFQTDVATSLDWIGHTLRRQGNLPGASDAYRKSLDLRQKLAARFPAEARWQRDLATSWMNLGDAFVSGGDLNGALDAYRRSLAIDEQQATANAADTEWQHDLVTALISVGDVLRSQNDLAGALAAFQRALAIQQKLLESDPRNALWQRDLAVCLENVGDIIDAQGDHAGALKEFEKALAVHRHLAVQDPSNAVWQGELFVGYVKVGDVQLARGQIAEAAQKFRDGLALAQALVGRDQTNAGFQRTLSIAHERLGQTLKAQADLDGARQHLDESLTIRRKLVALDRTNTDSQRDLFVSLVQVGDLLVLQHKSSEAAKYYWEALRVAEQLVGRDRDNADWQRDLSEVKGKLGRVLASTGDTAGALSLLQDSAAIYLELSGRNPDDVALRLAAAEASFHLARALVTAHSAGSEADIEKALNTARSIAAELHAKRDSLSKDDRETLERVESGLQTIRR